MRGLEAPPIKNKVALRASVTGSIYMDSVNVPHDHLLPHGQGLSAPFSCLNSARYVRTCVEADCGLMPGMSGTVFPGVPWERWRTASRRRSRMRSSDSNSSVPSRRSSSYKRSWLMRRPKSPWVYKPVYKSVDSRRQARSRPRWSVW